MRQEDFACDVEFKKYNFSFLQFQSSELFRGMIGAGKAHIRTCVAIAQAQLQDAASAGTEVPATIAGFASLGSFGAHSSSEERDLHKWLDRLHGIQIQPYHVAMKLEAQSLVVSLGLEVMQN